MSRPLTAFLARAARAAAPRAAAAARPAARPAAAWQPLRPLAAAPAAPVRPALALAAAFHSAAVRADRARPPQPAPEKSSENLSGTGADAADAPPAAADAADDLAFKPSERARRASQINLSAQLSADSGPTNRRAGLRRLFSLARPETWPIFAGFVLLCISSAVTAVLPFSIGKVMDVATHSGAEDGTIFGLTLTQFCLCAGALTFVGAAANFGRIAIMKIVGERLVGKLRARIYRQTVMQDAEFFDANRVGDLISRLSSDANIVAKSVTQNVSDGLRALVSGTAGISMMCYVSLELSSVVVFIIPPVVAMVYVYSRRLKALSRQVQDAVGESTKVAEERLSNIRTAQAFSAEIQEVHRYNARIRDIFALGKREALLSAAFFSSNGLFGNLTILTILSIGSSMVLNGHFSFGDLTSFLMYVGFTGSSFAGLSSFQSELMKGLGAAERLFELEDRKPTITATVGRPVPDHGRGVIEFRDVRFAYPTRPAVNIFDGLSFAVPPGKNVCIVGPSGGGKSTISQLLLRFYDVSAGAVTINGEDIRSFNLKSLRRTIGIVAQEPVLFSGTIAENIMYGKPGAARADVVAAARRANCDFIGDFPDGLETQVGARGTQLSGGQKQRIAIARALIRDPSILILDEATSALDAESEAAVNTALNRLMRSNCTTISIAHRLSTIKRSDWIVVLNGTGSVAEEGTYAALAADPESYFAKLLMDNTGADVGAEPELDAAAARAAAREDNDVLAEQLRATLEADADAAARGAEKEIKGF
ncbi:P-loop containing nucleoside triphosphate hydrolase protein [Dipodascopsis tothii]|uniref:P-loop containing nucleoside triphosphate hydrolase protein n=1 Tax=Dipodascopsis tothii TaxID=44089 RepID=UPI0034CEAB47